MYYPRKACIHNYPSNLKENFQQTKILFVFRHIMIQSNNTRDIALENKISLKLALTSYQNVYNV